ncbi:hypothetical protein HMI55_000623 [Coelomomyces lativittatus]|nr:hypothetical protein HMI55_000623 [Coelomomyces lativittatus]
MGLLSQGTPLDWEEAKKYADYIRHQGIQQFLACYRRNKDAGKVDTLLWGDEVEYTLLRFDHESKKVALSLRGYDVLTELMQEEHDAASIGRKAAEKYLNENEFLCAITCFPLLGVIEKGVATCFYPPINLNDGKEHMETSQSHYIPDVAINPHPRFKTLTANIRKRRGAKVSINLPLYKDEKTLCPFIDPALQVEYESGIKFSCISFTFTFFDSVICDPQFSFFLGI